MASRALWKGQLRLSLVSVPVELHSATQPGARISFRQIHKPSGRPVRYEKVVPGIGPVETDDIVKGYEYDKDNYVLLDKEEVEAIRLETKKTFELVQFVGGCEIPPLYFDKPYYLVPTDELAEQAYRVLRDAMRQAEKIGIGQITLRGREYLAAVKPCGDGLLLETLHYVDEIRKAERLFAGIEDETADEELLDVATALIDRKTSPFDASAYHDSYAEAMRELIEDKLQNKRTRRVSTEETEEARPAPDNVIDLMAVLKKSLANSKQGTGAGKASAGGKKSAPRKKAAKSGKSGSSRKSAPRKKAS